MIRSGQFSSLFEISSFSTLSASFRNILLKLNKLCWWQTCSYCKPMEPCGSLSNQGFHWNSIKAYAINPPPEAYCRWEMTDISLQTVEIYLAKGTDGQRTKQYLTSSSGAFSQGEQKYTWQKKLGIFVCTVKWKETKTYLKSEIDIFDYIISFTDKSL